MKELVYPRLLTAALQREPASLAFIDDDGTQETLEVHVDRSLRIADAHRRELGLAPDDRFAVLAGNSRHYVNLWHAAFLGGGVINPLNIRLAPAELAFILEDSSARVVHVDATFAPVIAGIRDQLPSLDKVVQIDDGTGELAPGCDAFLSELVAAGDATMPDPEESDPVVLMYTGGTTGLPKGVLHNQRSQVLNIYRLNVLFGFFSQRVTWLNATPMFHAGGVMGTMAVPCSSGTTIVHGGFDPARVARTIAELGVTHTGLVPTMIGMIIDHPDFDPACLSGLKKMGYGASPMPEALLDRLLEMLPHVDLVQMYGMTEASAVLTMLSGDDHRAGGRRIRSAGRALPGVELSIQDESGAPLPPDTVGEVCARAGSFMEGYFGRPEETAKVFVDGWYRSGDVGQIDAEGYLYLVDRSKDMIVTGGENVYSTEVEDAISTHPDVLQVAVIGIPSERWGEQVHAIVVPRPGAKPSESDLVEHARERIANYKVPKSVELRAEPLPLSGAMKVLKRELRAPFWEGRSRSID